MGDQVEGFAKVYFVSAEILAAGELGTWAMNVNPGKRATAGSIIAVSDAAEKYSDWGADIDPTSPRGTVKNMGWDGAFESQECF
jgi:hypothetical protein